MNVPCPTRATRCQLVWRSSGTGSSGELADTPNIGRGVAAGLGPRRLFHIGPARFTHPTRLVPRPSACNPPSPTLTSLTSPNHSALTPAGLSSTLPTGDPLDQDLSHVLDAEETLLEQLELHGQLYPSVEANADDSKTPDSSDHGSSTKMRDVPAATAIVQRQQDGHCSLEETLLEIYYANISLHEAQEISHTLWGDQVDLAEIRRLCRLVIRRTADWLERPLRRSYTYVFFDSIQLARRGEGNTKSMSVLLAVGVDARGFREVLGVAESGAGTDIPWVPFLRQLKKRGLAGVKLCVGGYDADLIKGVARYFPDADYQGCIAQMSRSMLLLVPATKEYLVIDSLQRIHSSNNRKEARVRVRQATAQLKAMGLPDAATLLSRIGETTLSYFSLPKYQWHRVNTTESVKKILRVFRERARVLGCIHDDNVAVQLVGVRLRYIMRTSWGRRRFINVARS